MPLDHLKKRLDKLEKAVASPRKLEMPTEPVPPATIRPPKEPKAAVKHQCGHTVSMAHLESIPCPGCREANRKAKRAADNARRAAQRPNREWPNRLPPGSRKIADWNGVNWSGSLSVPGAPEFELSAENERELMHALHAAYVEYLNGPCKRAD